MQRVALEGPWISLDNLLAFVSFIARRTGYDILPEELSAIESGVRSSNAESGLWYEYEFAGENRVNLRLATDPGSGVVWWRAECPVSVSEAVESAAEIMQLYRLSGPNTPGSAP